MVHGPFLYTSKSENQTDLYGNPVEEYEIQFIGGFTVVGTPPGNSNVQDI